MDIILLRHGETLDNISKVFGRDDTVLSEAGKKEVLNKIPRFRARINEIFTF